MTAPVAVTPIAARPGRDTLVALAARVGREAAGPAAVAVDRDARFPTEAFAALREARLLSAMVPVQLGGFGADIGSVAAVVEELGRHCASTALVYAMHSIQVACLLRHGRNELLEAVVADVAEHQLLLASATTEMGIGGDVRRSSCAVEREGDSFRLQKQAPVISYGAHCDAILVTARRDPGAAPSDQVLVWAPRSSTVLEVVSTWDTLGFRGTCSNGFLLTTEGRVEQVLSDPFPDISAQTMLPTSHVLWASAWLGLARSAVTACRGHVRDLARRKPGETPPEALRLAELVGTLEQMRALVHSAVADNQAAIDDPEALGSMAFALRVNGLKVSTSQLLIDVVSRALQICGLTGYREDSPFSLGRHLRDAHGAALMVSNERVLGASAQMVLVLKDSDAVVAPGGDE